MSHFLLFLLALCLMMIDVESSMKDKLYFTQTGSKDKKAPPADELTLSIKPWNDIGDKAIGKIAAGSYVTEKTDTSSNQYNYLGKDKWTLGDKQLSNEDVLGKLMGVGHSYILSFGGKVSVTMSYKPGTHKTSKGSFPVKELRPFGIMKHSIAHNEYYNQYDVVDEQDSFVPIYQPYDPSGYVQVFAFAAGIIFCLLIGVVCCGLSCFAGYFVGKSYYESQGNKVYRKVRNENYESQV